MMRARRVGSTPSGTKQERHQAARPPTSRWSTVFVLGLLGILCLAGLAAVSGAAATESIQNRVEETRDEMAGEDDNEDDTGSSPNESFQNRVHAIRSNLAGDGVEEGEDGAPTNESQDKENPAQNDSGDDQRESSPVTVDSSEHHGERSNPSGPVDDLPSPNQPPSPPTPDCIEYFLNMEPCDQGDQWGTDRADRADAGGSRPTAPTQQPTPKQEPTEQTSGSQANGNGASTTEAILKTASGSSLIIVVAWTLFVASTGKYSVTTDRNAQKDDTGRRDPPQRNRTTVTPRRTNQRR